MLLATSGCMFAKKEAQQLFSLLRKALLFDVDRHCRNVAICGPQHFPTSWSPVRPSDLAHLPLQQLPPHVEVWAAPRAMQLPPPQLPKQHSCDVRVPDLLDSLPCLRNAALEALANSAVAMTTALLHRLMAMPWYALALAMAFVRAAAVRVPLGSHDSHAMEVEDPRGNNKSTDKNNNVECHPLHFICASHNKEGHDIGPPLEGLLVGCLSQIKTSTPICDAVWFADSKNTQIFEVRQRKQRAGHLKFMQ